MAIDLPIYTKETLVRGAPARIRCVEVGGQVYTIGSGPLREVRLEEEWYEDVADPASVIDALERSGSLAVDLFTFWQRMPDTSSRYAYHTEWEDIAVLPVSTYDAWWNHQIKSRVRNQIRKAGKEGLVVKEVDYDDAFVRGMTAIFNEAPVRQGRSFWHYGKDFETVKRQFSRFVFRERMIGAYVNDEMVGFMMLANTDRFALVGQILSSLRHRDRLPNQALMAKAVEICATHQLPYLVYLFWSDDSLSEFKRRCGFESVRVPRYYVPLSRKGSVAMKLGLHRGLANALPANIKTPLKRLRARWHGLRSSQG